MEDYNSSSQPSMAAGAEHDSNSDGMETDDTPLSSSPRVVPSNAGEPVLDGMPTPQKGKAADMATDATMDDADDEDDDMVGAMPAKRARVRTTFIVDSSDEE